MRTVRRVRKAPNKQQRRGAAMVEAALCLPLLVVMVLGVVEFGRAQAVSQIVTNAAHEGARRAIHDGSSNAEVTQIVNSFLQSALGIDPGNVSVSISVTPAAGNQDPLNEVANANTRDLCLVEVYLSFDSVSYVPGHFLGGKDLLGQCAMRHL